MSNFFQLQTGQYVMDERVSAKLTLLKSLKPDEKFRDTDTGYSWDDAGFGDLYAELYEKETRYCPEAKSWYSWDGTRWVRDVEDLIVSDKVKEFFRVLLLYCSEIEDENRRDEFNRFVMQMGDRRKRVRIIADARDTKLKIHIAEFDSYPNVINCQNGYFDLNKMTWNEPDPDMFLTMQTNFPFKARRFQSAEWRRFITQVTDYDDDKAEYLQKALGYSIFGDAQEDCMFILYGKTTRNGKSTLLDAICHLLGDYAKTAPVELICKQAGGTKNAETANPVLAGLRGKRFVTMSESDSASRIDESVLKQYTGGEDVTARELYRNSFTFHPQFTLWLSCNDLPAVRDRSLFASDRVRVIEFSKHFSAEEQDKEMGIKLRKIDVMQGMFTWLIEGYRKYRDEGLVMPEKMRAVVRQYERDNDVVLQFLEAECSRTDGETSAKDLYARFKTWSLSSGFKRPLTVKKFNAELTSHVDWYDDKHIVHGVTMYAGITINGMV